MGGERHSSMPRVKINAILYMASIYLTIRSSIDTLVSLRRAFKGLYGVTCNDNYN